MTLGTLIKEHRKQSGYTQRQLAKLVDAHYTTISHLEADRIAVSNELIEQIAYQICDTEYLREQLCVLAGIFDMKAITQLASSDPLICKLLRQLPEISESKIMAIYGIMTEVEQS